MSELFSTPSNTFYKNNVISFTGINASGKTSVLKLITFVFGMLNNTPINSITCSEVLDGIADNNTVSSILSFSLKLKTTNRYTF